MQTFYKIVDNNVQVGSGEFVPEGFTEYVVGQEPQDLKDALAAEHTVQNVQAIKAKAEQLITAIYPDFKQLNIIRVGGEELVSMSAYIDGIRAISNQAELAGTDVNEVDWKVL